MLRQELQQTRESLAARDAEDAGHGLTLIHCLAQGIVWTLIQCRQFDDVRPYVAKLRQTIYRHGMAAWIPVANCYDAVVAAMAGERPDPEQLRSLDLGKRATDDNDEIDILDWKG